MEQGLLLLNLWAEFGLCNGATEEVRSLIYKNNIIPPSLPTAVLVKFDNYNKHTFCDADLVLIYVQ